jgi:5'-methylthioinosine phosphorylase
VAVSPPGTARTAIVGGTGLDQIEGLDIVARHTVKTPYGTPSDSVVEGRLGQHDVLFLARHGGAHHLPPHRINYRANIWALRELGAQQVLAATAVGGISATLKSGSLVIPDQIIDYTWGRDSTFHEPPDDVVHIDFTQPYGAPARGRLLAAAARSGLEVVEHGVYGATQGPRLESAAEIDRMERDGCTVVGMTGMPEAALAREAKLDYAVVALVVNLAAGRSGGAITMAQIEAVVATGMVRVRRLLTTALAL